MLHKWLYRRKWNKITKQTGDFLALPKKEMQRLRRYAWALKQRGLNTDEEKQLIKDTEKLVSEIQEFIETNEKA